MSAYGVILYSTFKVEI